MRIDAHQHFWQTARGDYDWLTAEAHPLIHRDFMPEDLEPLMRSAGVDRTILVQAAPTAAETAFLLDIAGSSSLVAGVVGWCDFEAPDAADRISALAERPKLVGLRPMIQDIADTEWMLRPGIAPALGAMSSANLTFDALVKPRHLPALLQFLELHPDLGVVIDHGAKPDIAGGEIALWSNYMRHIARESAAFCKISGLATEAGRGWSTQSLRPWIDVLLEAFGPSRLMWGSDWPVLNEAGDYLAWHAAAGEATSHLSQSERARIFGGTAAEFYGIAP